MCYQEKLAIHQEAKKDVQEALESEARRLNEGDRIHAKHQGITVEQLRRDNRIAGKPYDFSGWA